jgi:hypothetical protein
MTANLSHDEELYIRQFLAHGIREQHTIHILANLFLLFGGVLIIGTIVYLLGNTTDAAVFLVAIPGILCGLLLILLYILLSKKERHDLKLHAILTKFMG